MSNFVAMLFLSFMWGLLVAFVLVPVLGLGFGQAMVTTLFGSTLIAFIARTLEN